MYKIFKRMFSRAFFVAAAVLFQIVWFVGFVTLLGTKYPVFAGAIRAISIVAVLWIVNKRINPSYKLAWTMLILSMPLVGAALYLIFGRSRVTKLVEETFDKTASMIREELPEQSEVRERLQNTDERINRQSLYLRDFAGYPLYENTATEYYDTGEALFSSMVKELEKAKHFIFLEYFIIDNGLMWGKILDILEEKAAAGLDVRLIYDDVGCVNTLPAKFYLEIRARGIKCEVFNRFRPVVATIMNNRDHRKIMVIDGCVGFTGGINLADEYINRKRRFGHWKDSGIMIKGDAVWNFTMMFLQMWATITGKREELQDVDRFRPKYYSNTSVADGFVQPYSDSPLDHETVGENVYLNIIHQAKRYVYIFTPYLIIDNEMMTALCLAAKSGVDVRIVVPGIPDKKIIFLLSKSYYHQLLDAGVEIYEYSPGFLHAKSFVCDDEIATVGTVNLDYRSLYLHFECGVWMYQSAAVLQLKDDVLRTLENSRRVTIQECQSRGIFIRLVQSILRLLAPML